mgnify:FL=1
MYVSFETRNKSQGLNVEQNKYAPHQNKKTYKNFFDKKSILLFFKSKNMRVKKQNTIKLISYEIFDL